ncbi:MAG TPA: FGGY family carbohydrate kinase [Candidatus Limnocylindrales bacterium]
MDTAPRFAGLDIGTSRIKAVVIDVTGRPLSTAATPTPWTSAGTEIDAGSLLVAALACLGDALDRVPGAPPVALGIASIAETGFLCDPTGIELTRGIAWHDPRGRGAVTRLASDVGERSFAETTGLPLSATASIAKMDWLLAQGSFPRGTTWLGVAEWLAVALGAQPRAELSLASRTGLLDIASRAPSSDLTAWLGRPEILPPLVVAGEPVGVVTARFERLAGSVLVLAGHDHLCAAVGAGAQAQTDLLNSCGTGEAFIASTGEPMSRERIGDAVERGLNVGWHVLAGRRSVIGSLATGVALTRVLELIGAPHGFASLEGPRARRDPDSSRVRIDGLFDETLQVRVTGAGVTPDEVWAAAVAEAHDHSMLAYDRIRDWMGGFERVVGTGGWLRSREVLGRKVRDLAGFSVAPAQECAALGAALLAGVGAGFWPDAESVPRLGAAVG